MNAIARMAGAILLLASIISLSGGYAPNFGYTAGHDFGVFAADAVITGLVIIVLVFIEPKLIEDRQLRSRVLAVRNRITTHHRTN